MKTTRKIGRMIEVCERVDNITVSAIYNCMLDLQELSFTADLWKGRGVRVRHLREIKLNYFHSAAAVFRGKLRRPE